MKNAIKIISRFAGAVITTVLCYYIINGVLGITFGIKMPEPLYNPQPKQVVLSDPHFDQPYSKTVDPNEIQKLLDRHSYGREYKVGVFDCSDMSREDAKYLSEQGYHTSVIGDDIEGKDGHAWVYVWTAKNTAWAIEATSVSEIKNNSGEIVGDDWYDFHFVIENIFDKNPFEFYYPTVNRDTLHVIDWNDQQLDRR